MSAVISAPADLDQPDIRSSTAKRLWVTWQHPQSRTMSVVGCLALLPDQTWVFQYVRRVLTVEDFRPFVHFPDLRQVYRSDEIFPIFANRIMSPRRPDYPEYLRALDLNDEATPFDVLARSSGDRATDAIRVHPEPTVDPVSGITTCRFLAHGVRHIVGATERITQLKVGDRLSLRPDPGNVVNPRALLLDVSSAQPVGYIPDLLVDYVHTLLGHRGVEVRVDHVNPPHVPAALRLVCWLAGPWPPGHLPFTGEAYEPLADSPAE